jgi:DNA cross-link repair 1C protein
LNHFSDRKCSTIVRLKSANCRKSLDGKNAEMITHFRKMLVAGQESTGSTLSLSDLGFNSTNMELPLATFAEVIAKSLEEKRKEGLTACYGTSGNEGEVSKQLPRIITFPYSRHSSLHELQDLVKIFRPKDVYPCTVDENKWHESWSP